MMYYSLNDQNSISGLRYEMQQLENFGISTPRYPLSYIEYVKLDTDGHLRMYQYFTREKSSTNVVDMVTSDCKNISSNRYHLMQVRNIAYSINISKDAIEAGQQNTCLLACQRNCSCNAAVFIHENDISNGTCYFPSEIVSVGEEQTTDRRSATFIKVLNPNGISSPSPPEFIPPSPPFEPQPNLSPSPSPLGGDVPEILPPSSPPGIRKNLAAILSLSMAGGFIIIVIIITCLVMLRKKKLEDGDGDEDGEDNMSQVPGMLISFSYKDLEVATENFKEKLGTGGFGSVFKGIRADGTRVAVKRLDKMSRGKREFLAEVETIGSLHHFNLVKLVGFCAEKSCRLLVYEYMINGSLDNWIFSRDRSHTLDWQTRKKIILDIAKGLAYLHEDCRQKIIHLDIKPHNILLDEYFNAKVSDFGLSTLIDRNESQVLTTMRGTPGYLAPEWQQLRVTVKVDVYSFGIVLLEIVTKRKNVDPSRSESSFHLLKMLQKKAEEEKLIDIVEDLDEEMENKEEEMVRTIKVAAWCLQNDHTRRPLMSTVVKVLEGVMEVDQNIMYMFSHALASTSVANDHMTVAPQASMLSAPR
ncbi:G-type lectin S-receptor-like serine/threonine-protein kinase SD2-5 [Ziziphus jujuba]|uniref:G-type lectin S-receptor-like serine/threonine-protein kinase SD2-5 n=1 Tax=Ziziphus jujuba TaxID=326968 RepID=A0ABM4A5V5_ZIZJJ|nr:G-type lectin S-receptor-like serine/threonine-protein kinase SD2-5 [Ziziphus jujuba]